MHVHVEENWGESWPLAECDKATVNLSLHSPRFPDLRVPGAQEPLNRPLISKSKNRRQDLRDEF